MDTKYDALIAEAAYGARCVLGSKLSTYCGASAILVVPDHNPYEKLHLHVAPFRDGMFYEARRGGGHKARNYGALAAALVFQLYRLEEGSYHGWRCDDPMWGENNTKSGGLVGSLKVNDAGFGVFVAVQGCTPKQNNEHAKLVLESFRTAVKLYKSHHLPEEKVPVQEPK